MTQKPVVVYQVKGIPAELWKRCQRKAAAAKPPVTMRHVILTLLYQWIGSEYAGTDTDPSPSDHF